jgi:hypothetical protein
MAKEPMFSMRAAQQRGSAAGPIREVPVDLCIRDFRNNTYLVLRAGDESLLLTECEARALAVAIRKLSVMATALDNARSFTAEPGTRGGR